MTIKKARSILSFLWVGLSAPLVLFAVVLSATKFSNDQWDVPWSWLIPLVIPTLSLIIAVWSVGGTPHDEINVKSMGVFWCTLALTLLYFVAIYLVVLLYPLSSSDLATHLRTSGWYLGLLQGLTTVAVGKFYVENVG